MLIVAVYTHTKTHIPHYKLHTRQRQGGEAPPPPCGLGDERHLDDGVLSGCPEAMVELGVAGVRGQVETEGVNVADGDQPVLWVWVETTHKALRPV